MSVSDLDALRQDLLQVAGRYLVTSELSARDVSGVMRHLADWVERGERVPEAPDTPDIPTSDLGDTLDAKDGAHDDQ